jgi:hypothetical protein
MTGAFVARADTRHTEVRSNTGELKADNHVFFGESAGKAGDGPQAFMVVSPKGRAGHPHFHNVDQYQVFFPSPGATYKNKPIERPLLHYADAFTAYGPYASGADVPMQYLTLRARHSSITAYVPEERDKLSGVKHIRRHVAVTLDPPHSLGQGETRLEVLIEPDSDGLAAYLLQAGPGAVIESPRPAASGGRYTCILAGSVVDAEQAFAAESLRWDGPQERADRLIAGKSGVRALIMQFPDPPTPDRYPASSG